MIKNKYNKIIVFAVMSIIILLTYDFQNNFISQGSTLIIIFLMTICIFKQKVMFSKIYDTTFFYLILWIIFLIIALISSLMSYYSSIKSITTGALVFGSSFLFILLMLCDQQPYDTFKKIINSIIMYSIILCLIGEIIYFWGTSPVAYDSHTYRQFLNIGSLKLSQITMGTSDNYGVALMTSNPNIGGMIVSIGCISTIHLFFSTTKKNIKILWLIFSFLQIVGVVLTDSRGSIFALFVMILVYVFLSLKNSLLKGIVRIYSIFILLVSYLSFQFLNVSKRDINLSGRGEIWNTLLESVVDNPLLGMGFGVSGIYLKEKGFTLGSHSSQLLILSEVGIIGYICFLCITLLSVYLFLKKTKYVNLQHQKFNYLCIAILVGIFTNSFVENSILTFSALHFLYLYLLTISFINFDHQEVFL